MNPGSATLVVFLGMVGTGFSGAGAWAARARDRSRRRLPSAPSAGTASRKAATDAAPLRLVEAIVSAGFEAQDPARVWRVWTIGGTGLVAATALAWGWGPAAVAMVAVVAVLPMTLWALRDRGAGIYEERVPALLDDVAAGLRAGSSLLVALEAAAERAPIEVGRDLGRLVDSVAQGASFDAELDRWFHDRPLPAVKLATVALAVGLSTGGRQARSVELVGSTLRERSAVRGEAVALATQARASAMVMAVIPLVFAVAAATLDPRVGHVLLATPLGLACLAGGLALEGIAALWMARITRNAR